MAFPNSLPSHPPSLPTCEVPPHKQTRQSILGLHCGINKVECRQGREVPQHVVKGAEEGFLKGGNGDRREGYVVRRVTKRFGLLELVDTRVGYAQVHHVLATPRPCNTSSLFPLPFSQPIPLYHPFSPPPASLPPPPPPPRCTWKHFSGMAFLIWDKVGNVCSTMIVDRRGCLVASI